MKMKLVKLLENLKFGNMDPKAEPLYVDKQGGRYFLLKPGQSLREYNAPGSLFFVGIKHCMTLFYVDTFGKLDVSRL